MATIQGSVEHAGGNSETGRVRPRLANIQHLRAFAVISVFLFHLGVEGAGWGFIGVDIFFVISGFIMALLTFDREFSFPVFMLRRVRRLVPALTAMLMAVLLAGMAVQTNSELYTTSVTALANLVAMASFYISDTTGYFDIETRFRPLLHTWSLSIEWICYLVLAVLLSLFSRGHRVTLAVTVAAVCAVYLLSSLLTIGSVGYYDVPARMFLFFAGYLFFAWQGSGRAGGMVQRHALLVAGIVAIGLMILYADFDRWPGYYTLLLPVCVFPFMTFDVLAFNAVLSDVIAYIGDISYSLYLWHWPVIWFIGIQSQATEMTLGQQLLAVMLTAAISMLSYHYLERHRRTTGLPGIVAGVGLVTLLAGWNWHSGGSAAASVQRVLYGEGRVQLDKSGMIVFGCAYSASIVEKDDTCRFITPEPPIDVRQNGFQYWREMAEMPESPAGETVFIAGDSHSLHFAPLLLAREAVTAVHRLGLGVDSDKGLSPAEKLLAMGEEGIDRLFDYFEAEGIRRVYLAYRFSNKTPGGEKVFLDLLDRLRDRIAVSSVSLFVIRDVPSYAFDPLLCYNAQVAALFGSTCAVNLSAPVPFKERLNGDTPLWDTVVSRFNQTPGLKLIDTHQVLCGVRGCDVTIAGHLIYRDTNHINERLPTTVRAELAARIFGSQTNATGGRDGK